MVVEACGSQNIDIVLEGVESIAKRPVCSFHRTHDAAVTLQVEVQRLGRGHHALRSTNQPARDEHVFVNSPRRKSGVYEEVPPI